MNFRMVLLGCLLSLGGTAVSQTVLLEEDVKGDTLEPKRGPNYKNYFHQVLGYGFVFGETEGDGADIIDFSSSYFQTGSRYKLKLSNFYAIGYELAYSVISFHLVQDSAKVFPNNTLHHKEKLICNNLKLGLYNRFNFGKRGNQLGKYIDLGGYGEWVFLAKHTAKDQFPIANAAGGSRTTTSNTGLLYTSDLNYGLCGRIGFNKLAVFGKYRMSDMFKPSYVLFPELPRIVIGLEFVVGT